MPLTASWTDRTRPAASYVRRVLRDARARGWRGLVPGAPEVLEQARTHWHKDVLVGISVAAVAIPGSLGMADLAGVAPTAGLYATMFPLLAYALIGSSRKLVVGPDGALSSLTASSLAPFAAAHSDRYAALAAGLGIVTGLIMYAAAALRLGFMADFLSKPVLIGYFNGVALAIISGQLGKLFGFKIESGKFFGEIWELLTHLGRTSVATLALSASLLTVALLLRAVAPKAPVALVVVVLAAGASALFSLSGHGVATVGPVDSGLPVPRLPRLAPGDFFDLALTAVGLALVSFGDVMAITRTYATRDGHPISPERELAGVGTANIVSGLTQGMPVSSSGSRTAVNAAAGGRTQVVGLTVAGLTVLVAAFATGVLTDLPKAALGVVLVVAALGMLTASGVARLRRVHNFEAALALAATLAVLLFNVLGGLMVAIGLSIGVFVYRAVRPHDAVLGKVEDVDGYHDIDHSDAPVQTVPGLIVYRFDAPLFFPNARYFKERVLALVDESPEPVAEFLLNAEAMTYIDSTAVEALRELHAALRVRGVVLAVARAKWFMMKIFDSSGLTEVIGPEHFHPTVRVGVRAFRDR
ncbi:SulP family inorganic anion transporter [Catenulispora yoronensis]|uniref:SulP family inorganic anion transporter n=1 Tax=Catenulispora yoronensis TaxID=450799 RepID=A0ABN2V1D5_9ACTN